MEPWLRPDDTTGPDDGAAQHHRDLLTSLAQAHYWLRQHVEATPDEALYWEPAPGIPSIGARLHHVLRASERLATYAFVEAPDYEQLAADASQDWTPPRCSKSELLAAVDGTFERIRQHLQGLSPEALPHLRAVGRRRIPVRCSTILHHIAEHAAYHAGQLILLLRLWQAHQASSADG